MPQISRQEYSSLYGPTVGDKIRLGDTDLYVEIEKDLRGYGDEVIYGGGKTLRLRPTRAERLWSFELSGVAEVCEARLGSSVEGVEYGQ